MVHRGAEDRDSVTLIYGWQDATRTRELVDAPELHEATKWLTGSVSRPVVPKLDREMDSPA